MTTQDAQLLKNMTADYTVQAKVTTPPGSQTVLSVREIPGTPIGIESELTVYQESSKELK